MLGVRWGDSGREEIEERGVNRSERWREGWKEEGKGVEKSVCASE
jgi:hypothetical protein